MQPVLTFQLFGNGYAAFVAPAVFDLAAVLPDLHRHDVNMPAVDVGMLEHDVRLLAPAHAFHIFLGDFRKLLGGQTIFGVGIERDVYDGLLGAVVRGHPAQQVFGRRRNVESPVERFPQNMRQEHFALVPIDLLLVVGKCSVYVFPDGDFGYHRF